MMMLSVGSIGFPLIEDDFVECYFPLEAFSFGSLQYRDVSGLAVACIGISLPKNYVETLAMYLAIVWKSKRRIQHVRRDSYKMGKLK